MMTIRSLWITVVLCAATLVGTPLSAQTSGSSAEVRGPTGLFLGANFTGSFVNVNAATVGGHTLNERGLEGGGGMHFTVGYAFTPTFSVTLHAGGVLLNEEEDRTLGGVELALRHSFTSTSSSLRPYMELGLGGFALQDDSNGQGEFTGGGLSVAAGFEFFVTRRVALNTDFRYNTGMFTTVSMDRRTIADDARVGFGSSRMNFGVNWYPMAGKNSGK